MPIKIIDKDEQLEMKYEGEIFYYRRPPLKVRAGWVEESKNQKGEFSDFDLMEKAIDYCFTGWKTGAVIDDNNKNVVYKDSLKHMLPGSFYNKLIDKLEILPKENDLKN